MKRIVVPIDFSSSSMNGIELAILIASKIKASIELVHVYKKEENNLSPGEEKVKSADVRQSLDDIIKTYKKQNPEIEIDGIVKEGKVYQEVVSQAEAFKESFIVSSTHGSSGWEELFTGSNAYKIASSSTRPVFTIRGDSVPADISKIVLPLDNTPETREKVPLTASLALLFGAHIDIVTVNTFGFDDIVESLKDYAAQVSAYLSNRGIKNGIDHLKGNNQTDLIIDYAQKKKADLISIMTDQEKSLLNVLLGTNAHQMINRSPLPVLLFPTKQIGIITESFKTEGINY